MGEISCVCLCIHVEYLYPIPCPGDVQRVPGFLSSMLPLKMTGTLLWNSVSESLTCAFKPHPAMISEKAPKVVECLSWKESVVSPWISSPDKRTDWADGLRQRSNSSSLQIFLIAVVFKSGHLVAIMRSKHAHLCALFQTFLDDCGLGFVSLTTHLVFFLKSLFHAAINQTAH